MLEDRGTGEFCGGWVLVPTHHKVWTPLVAQNLSWVGSNLNFAADEFQFCAKYPSLSQQELAHAISYCMEARVSRGKSLEQLVSLTGPLTAHLGLVSRINALHFCIVG